MEDRNLTLEKLKIAERMATLEQVHRDTSEILKRITMTIYGNGQVGLTTKLSNAERGLKILNAVMWSMAVTLISLGIKTVFYKLVQG